MNKILELRMKKSLTKKVESSVSRGSVQLGGVLKERELQDLFE